MAQFIAGAEGNRQSVTRLGSKNSGATAYANGWNIGARAYVAHDDEDKRDYVTVSVTHGSSPDGFRLELGVFSEGMTEEEMIAAALNSLAYRLDRIGHTMDAETLGVIAHELEVQTSVLS